MCSAGLRDASSLRDALAQCQLALPGPVFPIVEKTLAVTEQLAICIMIFGVWGRLDQGRASQLVILIGKNQAELLLF